MPVPISFLVPDRAALIAKIASSYSYWFAKPLIPTEADIVTGLWNAPFALLAHGTEPDPLFFFGNRQALERFGYAPETFIGLASRLSAEPPNREERQHMLERVTQNGFIDDYAGVRITASGKRFSIDQATIWTLIDDEGQRVGQAARFAL